MVDAVASDLHAAGLKRGERVAVWLPNRVEAVAVLLACSRQGYVCNPSLHQNYRVGEIVELLSRIRAAALFAQPGYGADAKTADIFGAAGALPSLRRIYSLGDGPRRRRPYRSPDASDGRAPLPPPDADPDKIVYLAFTSGTTGIPKGVMHSDNTLLANGRAMVADWGHDEHSVLLSLSPMSHHIGTVAIEQMLAAGLELVVNAPPPGLTPLDWIIETGATYVMGVPTHAMDILAAMRQRRLDQAGRRQDILHGRLADPARDRAGLSRPRRYAAKRLRHDRERLAPVHLARRRPENHRRNLRAGLRRLRDPPVGPGQPRYAKPRPARSARSAAAAPA